MFLLSDYIMSDKLSTTTFLLWEPRHRHAQVIRWYVVNLYGPISISSRDLDQRTDNILSSSNQLQVLDTFTTITLNTKLKEECNKKLTIKQ